jgi:hypothetical protein
VTQALAARLFEQHIPEVAGLADRVAEADPLQVRPQEGDTVVERREPVYKT